MNKQLINLIAKATLLSAMVIVTSVASAQGQSLANRPRFDIPFDFAFGEKKLPAGRYTVGRAMESTGDITLSIADADGRSKAVALSMSVVKWRVESKALLVFHRYGDQYFLVQVWQAGATMGREFRRSKLEREVQQQLVSNLPGRKVVKEAEYQTVTVVAVVK